MDQVLFPEVMFTILALIIKSLTILALITKSLTILATMITIMMMTIHTKAMSTTSIVKMVNI